MKTKEKKIKISALIDSGCTHTTIAADTVQRERLQMENLHIGDHNSKSSVVLIGETMPSEPQLMESTIQMDNTSIAV